MTLPLLGVFASAVLAGLASVLQAYAAVRTPATRSLDPRLLTRLLRQRFYLLGLACTAGGFLLSIAALRSLPLFVVQGIRASSLAVTAVLAVVLLGAKLRRAEPYAVAIVAVGLILLAASTTSAAAPALALTSRWLLLAAVIVLAVVSAVVGRASGPRAGIWLGVCAGAAFGLLGVAARGIVELGDVGALIADPAAYALGLSGLLGLLLLVTALQRSSATSVTAAMVATETIGAAVLGLAMFGDRPVPGLEWMAIVGFACAVAGALELARHGVPAAPARDRRAVTTVIQAPAPAEHPNGG